MKRLLLVLVRVYQYTMSPWLGHRCRFFPSCSEYTIEGLQKYGAVKGLWLGIRRVARCHPWNPGGFDPLP